jgi:hypothetical protein
MTARGADVVSIPLFLTVPHPPILSTCDAATSDDDDDDDDDDVPNRERSAFTAS